MKSFLGLLGSKLPLQLVQLHVTAVLDLGLGPVKALLQLGDVSVDHLSLQPTVQPSRPALGGGGLMWLLGLALIPCQGVRHSGLLCGSVADMFSGVDSLLVCVVDAYGARAFFQEGLA